MNTLAFDSLAAYWSVNEISTNVVVFLNIFGALLLGLVVGYERSFHGRAAGMRTYGLVCMASAALVVVTGYPSYWYGGHSAAVAIAEPTARLYVTQPWILAWPVAPNTRSLIEGHVKPR